MFIAAGVPSEFTLNGWTRWKLLIRKLELRKLEKELVEIVNVTQQAFAFLDIPFTFVCLI